jgi:surface polysaccharide O-acyltransferase-like enzyme
MQNLAVSFQTVAPAPRDTRLYYLDWLRVIAILGVFLIHVTCVFNEVDFPIKSAEQSSPLTTFGAFFYPWGMPLVFLIAGAGSWFALQRRTPSQYARERFMRLLIPFIAGSILLFPLIHYFEWSHHVQTGLTLGSFPEYLTELEWEPNPGLFQTVGDHLWFLGFLFCYSLITLHLFNWLKGETGQRFISRMARLCEFRSGALLFILPLLMVRLSLQPISPDYPDWTDFVSFLIFYILGYLLFTDKRFLQAIHRDWPILLVVGIVAFLAAAAISFATDKFDLELVPRTPLDWAWWIFFTACSWCWTAFMLFVGMRFLNFSNKWLRYCQEAILPFYVFHMPVIVVIAYFVAQWNVGLLPKLLVVGLGAFAVVLGLYQFIIRRVGPLRIMFGMKA